MLYWNTGKICTGFGWRTNMQFFNVNVSKNNQVKSINHENADWTPILQKH